MSSNGNENNENGNNGSRSGNETINTSKITNFLDNIIQKKINNKNTGYKNTYIDISKIMNNYLNKKFNNQNINNNSINTIKKSLLFKFIISYLRYKKSDEIILYFTFKDNLFYYDYNKLSGFKISNTKNNNNE